ncbi:hypothetical protein CDD81_2107 [Ophiocordyceps australis]|uniref:F-box domain-containing protein n=1 Tax=Ophiocordyceps australis TaxID=1399860 RepID=A0A2C5XS58_9HYPO|nr:hypothetical protein CDD81_2107 [Ophiocordyceps australis]
MESFKALLDTLKRRPKPPLQEIKPKLPNPPGLTLMHLPVEILLLIADSLPLYARLMLSQTCRSMHLVFQQYMHPGPIPTWSKDQRLELLTFLVRKKPDHWVCEACERSHLVHWPEHPATAYRALLQDGPCPASSGDAIRRKRGPHQYMILYFHVQIALKITRLAREGIKPTRKQALHLQCLLQPELSSTHRTRPDWPRKTFSYSCTPKIVQGRFLVLSEWKQVPIQPRSRTRIEMCKHQRYHGYSANYPTSTQYPLQSTIVDALSTSQGNSEYGTEFYGACPSCRTDFSVRGPSPNTGKLVTLRSWQDFGPEDSPMNPDWRSQCRHPDKKYVCVRHIPGSVRRLYESAPCESRLEYSSHRCDSSDSDYDSCF